MPDLFEMRKEDSSFQLRGARLSLPGVNCPACVTWAGTGIDYPLARLAAGVDPAPFEDPSPVSVEEYRRRAALVEGVPGGCVLEPGSEFGPLAGSVRGTVRDVNFAFLWTVVVLRSAFDGLREEGLDLTGAAVLVRSSRFDLIELQIEPHSRIPASAVPGGVYPTPCPKCGRLDVDVPKPVVLDGRTIPRGKDIFRGMDLSTFIFVTERFRAAYERRKLRGALFTPVEVA